MQITMHFDLFNFLAFLNLDLALALAPDSESKKTRSRFVLDSGSRARARARSKIWKIRHLEKIQMHRDGIARLFSFV